MDITEKNGRVIVTFEDWGSAHPYEVEAMAHVAGTDEYYIYYKNFGRLEVDEEYYWQVYQVFSKVAA